MSILLIPLAAILMPLVLVPTTLFMKHRHKRREWEHRERMKEMEERLPIRPVQALGRRAESPRSGPECRLRRY